MEESPLSAALTHLRNGDTAISTFGDGPRPDKIGYTAQSHWHKFATETRVDIFDVRDGEGRLHRNLDETALRKHLTDNVEAGTGSRRQRIIFLDGDETNAESLPVTSEALLHIFKTYNISQRFAFFLSKQRMAGASVHYETDSRQPRRLGMRIHFPDITEKCQTKHTPDGSRKVMNWLRFFAWADFDASTGSSTCVALRYPVHLKERFFEDFAGLGAAMLEQHPMFMHASCLERITTLTREIHFSLCDPMYKLEEELGTGPTCSVRLFEIGRELTEFYRKMRQVKTDIDIVMSSTKNLRKQNEVLAEMMRSNKCAGPAPNYELQMQLDETFASVEKELELSAVYLSLYSERCNTSITIAHSLSNQNAAELQARNSEVQVKSSEELASLSRDSKEDNRSLRVIQLLGAVFLPSSLISGIFGMGFFTTDVDESSEGMRAVFAVSPHVWWYAAVTLPLTAAIVLLIVRDWIYHRVRVSYEWGRRLSVGNDLEKASSRKSQ